MPAKPGRKGHSLADIAELHEMPLTPQRIRDGERLVAEGAVDLDSSGRREWRDSSCPGLRIVVTRQGARFYFVGRLGGQVIRKPLGACGTVDLSEARAAAGRLRFDTTTAARITGGKKSAGGSLTLEKLWERYIAEAEAGSEELPDRFVSRDVAAAYCGLSAKTLATWASAGVGPPFSKLSNGRSGAVRYSLRALSAFMADPAAHGPRPVGRFNKPANGSGRIAVARARKRRNGKVKG